MTQVSLKDLIIGAQCGKVVSFPTDTVPALATLPEQAELIFVAKQRAQDKPLILMGGSVDQLWEFVKGSKEEFEIWQNIAQKYLPGALTLVLPASERVPKQMNPIDPTTIGIRVPRCAIAQTILTQTSPLATTSANLSGQPALLTMAEIDVQFPDVLTLASSEYQQDIPAIGIPSTVAKWTGKGWQILRQGIVELAGSRE
jgi:L-threonylcarbamoyladenylate synthase